MRTMTIVNMDGVEKEIEINNDLISEIAELYYEKRDDEKIAYLFNENGEFIGHTWGINCFYTESDLRKNGNWIIKYDHEFDKLLEMVINYIDECFV